MTEGLKNSPRCASCRPQIYGAAKAGVFCSSSWEAWSSPWLFGGGWQLWERGTQGFGGASETRESRHVLVSLLPHSISFCWKPLKEPTSCSSLVHPFLYHLSLILSGIQLLVTKKKNKIKKCKKRKEEKTKEKKKRKENKTQTKPTTITINSSALCITTNPSWARAFEKGLYIFLSEMWMV